PGRGRGDVRRWDVPPRSHGPRPHRRDRRVPRGPQGRGTADPPLPDREPRRRGAGPQSPGARRCGRGGQGIAARRARVLESAPTGYIVKGTFWKSEVARMGTTTATVTDSDFEQEVLKSATPVLVDFWAEWCGPCHMVAPVIDEIANENSGKLVVRKLDVDNNPETTRRYGVLSIPSMLLFVDSVEKARIVGARGKAQILSELSQYLA